jgi:hypothetical protein
VNDDLRELYQDVIIEHSKRPRNFHAMADANHAMGHNPLCGDRATIFLKLEGDRLTFDVDVLEGDLAGGNGPAALFIDRFGFGGFHGGGFHAGGMGGFHAAGFRGGYARVGGVGVWRRPYVARGAWYRGGYGAAAVGAAAVGGAALGAAATNAAYPYCGYYPYPPCY